jgi:phage tail protein X
MSVDFEPVIVQGEGLTVSLIVWRRFRRPMPGVVEAILTATPGLADLGHVLPLGTRFSIPVPQEQTEIQDVLEPIVLW